MQDIKAVGGVGGGGGSLFGVDRRLRALNQQQQHQPLKCPRCQSLNTKFCYYNNYNLSQPRHFCKGCRRYWTKGGVLRNVPVGGGSRKVNKPKQPSLSSDTAAAPPAKTISHSSSQSSSLTATTAAAVAGEVVSGGCGTSSNSAVLPPPPESSFFVSEAVPSNLNFNPSSVDGGSIFPEIGTFTGLMTASGYNMGDIWKYGLESENEERGVGNQNQEIQQQYVDDQIEYSGNRISNGGVAAVAWQAAGGEDHDHRNQKHDEDEGMFDLTGSDVDQAYWSQQITHCPDYHHHHNHSLHFLP